MDNQINTNESTELENESTELNEINELNEIEELEAPQDSQPNQANKKTPWMFILVGAVLLTALVTFFATKALAGSAKGDVVARVNNEVITKDELYNVMVKQGGGEALNSLIIEKIIDLELKKQNKTISTEEIDQELQKTIAMYGGQEALEAAIASYGYTIEDVKKDLKMKSSATKLIGSEIAITEDEMKEYYEANKASFATPGQVRASHILVETEEKAKEIKEKLAAGGNFEALAMENSTDEGSKLSGGDLGFFSSGQMVPEFEAAAFALKVGEISDIVKSDYGYHIIKLVDRKEATSPTYEQSKDQIKEIMFNEKLPAAFDEWMNAKYSEYTIENTLDKK